VNRRYGIWINIYRSVANSDAFTCIIKIRYPIKKFVYIARIGRHSEKKRAETWPRVRSIELFIFVQFMQVANRRNATAMSDNVHCYWKTSFQSLTRCVLGAARCMWQTVPHCGLVECQSLLMDLSRSIVVQTASF